MAEKLVFDHTQTRLKPLGPASYELVKLAALQDHEATFHVSWQA